MPGRLSLSVCPLATRADQLNGRLPPYQAPSLFAATDLITVYHTLAITPFTSAGASYFMITRQQASFAKNKPSEIDHEDHSFCARRPVLRCWHRCSCCGLRRLLDQDARPGRPWRSRELSSPRYSRRPAGRDAGGSFPSTGWKPNSLTDPPILSDCPNWSSPQSDRLGEGSRWRSIVFAPFA